MTSIETLIAAISTELKIQSQQVNAVVSLLDEGNTIPFIARYRKERTGSLDEEDLRKVEASLSRLRTLNDRRDAILKSIDEQGKLTDELTAKINAAATLTELEDLYAPYRPKRRTRASIARERGLESLAQLIFEQGRGQQSPDAAAADFVTDDVPSPAEALAGARDIVAEAISEDADVRGTVREKALRYGTLTATKINDAEDEKGVYRTYYAFSHRIVSIQPYQVLAVNRGEAEKILKVALQTEERDWRDPIVASYRPDQRSPFAGQLELAIQDCAKRLLLPAIERDVRRTLTEQANEHAIEVFAKNLRGLLSQPPLANQVVLGLDPGYRTGCKVAVVDSTGRVLDTATIYPHAPQKQWNKSLDTLSSLVQQHAVTLIAIGNGTASRESEALAAELTRGRADLHYLIVSEAGASVYSASKLARNELPDLDVTLRGAVSIARRVLDPLAELVKIDPKAIGVGLYQHDVDQKQLSQALTSVVESVVNNVGVDVNTASPALLTYVSGVGAKLAESIVAHRVQIGRFDSRKALKGVSGLGPKAFEQAAGFLRIREGDDPLDASAIHPESYKVAKAILKQAGLKSATQPDSREDALKTLRQGKSLTVLADELSTGVPTLADIFEQLVRPGRDPREDLPAPILRSDVLSMADLQPGMTLKGTVRNVVDFGAFVDIGVKQDGLLHRSQLPRDLVLTVSDVIDVTILNVDHERGRIGLSYVEPV